jgi:predicted DNA-binding WGR domain protein
VRLNRDFHFEGDGSHKFWTIELDGASCGTTYGRVGATPRETRKAHPDTATAQRDFERQIAAKLAKGYVEGSPNPPAPPARTDWSALSMGEEVFWRIIALFNWKRTGNDDAVLAPAVKALAQMSEADITAFEDLLA